jgi:hypothetical protein
VSVEWVDAWILFVGEFDVTVITLDTIVIMINDAYDFKKQRNSKFWRGRGGGSTKEGHYMYRTWLG